MALMTRMLCSQGPAGICTAFKWIPSSSHLNILRCSVITQKSVVPDHTPCQQYHKYSTALSKLHYRSIHNVQNTLPSFRRPIGIVLYEYLKIHGSGNQPFSPAGSKHKKLDNISYGVQRCIHSQKQQASQRPFILSPQGIVAASPEALRPYLKLIRLDRPIGTWLLFLPCAFSLSLAAPAGSLPDPYLIALFGLGSFLMRGAGCTINDMWDKDFDAKVERTKDRPLACGQINYFQALSFLGLQLSGALAILLSFNWFTIGLGVSSMALCITYPLMKRITYWPQAFLGLTLNYGVLISWAAVHGGLSVAPVLLYLAAGMHTMFYDTVYSHQDKADDILVGVKSTALWMGENTKPWLYGFTGFIGTALTMAGAFCDQTAPYYLGTALFTSHLLKQVYTVDLNNTDDCGAKFRSNRNLGIMFWLMIMAGNMMKTKGKDKTDKELDEKDT